MIVSINWQRVEQLLPILENYIHFQKCLLTVNDGGPSDRHFKYILDLTDKMLEKLAAIL